MKTPVVTIPIHRVADAESSSAQDCIAVEEPLQIRVNGRDLAITMRTPGHDADLAAGFLYGEGIVEQNEDIAGIEVTPGVVSIRLASHVEFEATKLRNFVMNSSCGVCGKASIDALQAAGCAPIERLPMFDPSILTRLPEKLREAQTSFSHTGGLHGAAIFDFAGNLLVSREDIGRHNAVDKLVGASLLAGQLPLSQHLLMLSGRVSFELAQKAIMAGIPVIAALGAPSSLAVETARRFGITLVGFLREGKFNVYSGSQNIC